MNEMNGSVSLSGSARVFFGIQYIGVFNFRYTVFLCLKLGNIKYSLTTNFGYKVYRGFLNLVFLDEF